MQTPGLCRKGGEEGDAFTNFHFNLQQALGGAGRPVKWNCFGTMICEHF